MRKKKKGNHQKGFPTLDKYSWRFIRGNSVQFGVGRGGGGVSGHFLLKSHTLELKNLLELY